MSTVKVTVRMDTSSVALLLESDSVQEKVINGSEAALKMQQMLVPVDTGHLRSKLEIRNTPDGLGRQIGAFEVGYALAVETGHHTKSGSWVPAQPFIRPSTDAIRRGLRNG